MQLVLRINRKVLLPIAFGRLVMVLAQLQHPLRMFIQCLELTSYA
jgi:hypothetical protein